MNRRRRIAGLARAAALLLLAGGAIDAAPQECTPYAPRVGTFTGESAPRFVPTTGTTLGASAYVISQNLTNLTVTVTKGGRTVAVVYMTQGKSAWYHSFPSSGADANRFLVLDVHTGIPGQVFTDFSPVLLDLGAWTGTPISGFPLAIGSYVTNSGPQYHVIPSQDGLAFYAYYGQTSVGNRSIEHANLYRSDGSSTALCSGGAYGSVQQPGFRILADAAELLDGGSVRARCPLPRGALSISPATQSFGSTSPSGTITKTYSLRNSGADCLSVSGITPSAHFRAVDFAGRGIPKGEMIALRVAFAPGGQTGTFSERLSATCTPTACTSAFTATGSSCAGFGTVTDCGTCGHPCPTVLNGTPSCTQAANTWRCGVRCNAGYAECAGACTDHSRDASNCGACGRACPVSAHGATSCVSGGCVLTCDPGYTECGGTCVALSSDVNNCGRCGNVCQAGPASSQTACSGGSCRWECGPGLVLCAGACRPSAEAMRMCPEFWLVPSQVLLDD